jgi:hypothetical protein
MREWSDLRHAYGTAADVPALLERLVPDPRNEVWDDLWSRLCHQGSVYSASFAALPSLQAAARTWSPAERLMPLCLAGAIVASEDVDGSREDLLVEAGVSLPDMHALALESLSTAHVSGADFISLAQAALAFEGESLWSRRLDRLIDGEFEGECASCAADLYLVIGQYGFFVTSEEWVNHPRVRRTPIAPIEPGALAGTGRWLHECFLHAGHDKLATWLEYLFGSSACPSCGAGFRVEDAIRRAV